MSDKRGAAYKMPLVRGQSVEGAFSFLPRVAWGTGPDIRGDHCSRTYIQPCDVHYHLRDSVDTEGGMRGGEWRWEEGKSSTYIGRG